MQSRIKKAKLFFRVCLDKYSILKILCITFQKKEFGKILIHSGSETVVLMSSV